LKLNVYGFHVLFSDPDKPDCNNLPGENKYPVFMRAKVWKKD